MSTLKSSRYWVRRVLSILRDECFVEVYLKDGSAIRGKITAAETKQLSGFALKEAIFTIVKDSVSYTAQKCQTMLIDTVDIVYISAKECEKKRLDALDEHLDRVLKEFSPSEYNSTCVPRVSVVSGPNLAESLSVGNTTLDKNLKDQIGDREKAMERFEKSYSHLFNHLTGCARRLHLMDAFFKSRDMFLG